MSPRTRRVPIALLLVLVLAGVGAAYSRVLDGGPIFDDVSIWMEADRRLENVSFEELRRASSDLGVESSRRLTNLTFALNFLWFGDGTTSFHAVNIAIHGLVVLALFGFVNQTTRIAGRSPESASRIALVAAAWFALNPIQTQAVSYMWQRSASLVALVCLTAMWLLARGLAGRRYTRIAYWSGAALLIPVAVLTKQNGATLAALMALFLWLFATDRSPRSMLRAGVVLAGVGAVLYLIVAPALFGTFDLVDIVRILVFPQPDAATGRLLTQPRVLLYLAGLVLLPLPSRLNFAHEVGRSSGLLDPWTTVAAMVAIAVLLIGAFAVARRRPLVTLGIVWYFALLLPEAAISWLATMSEHRAYLPSAGLALLVALGFERFGFGPGGHPRLAVVAASCLFVAMAAGTWVRNEVWTSSVAMWSDVAAKKPGNIRALWYLGGAWEDRAGELPPRTLQREAALDRAEETYQRALAIHPGDVPFSDSLARLRLDRGRWAREHPEAAAAELPAVFVAIDAVKSAIPEISADTLGVLDWILHEEITSWGALTDGGIDGSSETAAALARGEILGFRAKGTVTRVRIFERADDVLVECRFRIGIRRWSGPDGARTGRGVSLTERHRQPITTEDFDTSARDCLQTAARKLVKRRAVATLERLIWFGQNFPESGR